VTVKRKINRRILWPLALGVLGLANVYAQPTDTVEPETRLGAMATKLADTVQFSVTVHMKYDVLQDSGQMIEFGELRSLQLSRPDYLRIDAQQSDGDIGGLIFDGTTLTQFSQTDSVYSQIERPGTVDEVIRYAVGELSVRLPLARLLLSSFPEQLQRVTTEVDLVETNTLGPEPTDHIAGRTADIDYQVWIGEDNFPTRIVLSYKNAPGQPQFRADFSDWNTAPALRKESFNYRAPDDFEKIPVLLPARPGGESHSVRGGGE